MPILFSVTLFVSALLLFMVQPMIGRMILPLLGGSPAAWNTCMVFFQMMLLLGYLYAHKVAGKLSVKQQVMVHLGVLAAAIAAFAAAVLLSERGTPILIHKPLVPTDSAYPMFGVIALLFVAIGVPFFAVSASAPLLTKWFSRTDHPQAKDPYFLYATSNAGSLLSLLAYPILIEPQLSLAKQGWWFASGFVGLTCLVFLCGQSAMRHLRPAEVETMSNAAPPTNLRIFKWVMLAFVPSSLMLGVTFFVTTDIASISLLWIIPLALYLLTFIIAFSRLPSWFRVVLGNIAPVAMLLLLYIIITQESLGSAGLLIALHVGTFFLVALMCHTELSHDRPPPQFLTNFFLWISVGGMLGGVFNALIAPLLFPLAYEYTIALAIGCMMVPKLVTEPLSEAAEGRARLWDLAIPGIMLLAVFWMTAMADAKGITDLCLWISRRIDDLAGVFGADVRIEVGKIRDGLLWGLPLVVCFFFIERPLRFGLCVATIVFCGEFRRAHWEEHTERSFFGILKVRDFPRPPEEPVLRTLVHGTTIHGKQGLDPWPMRDELKAPLAALAGGWASFGYDWRVEPLTYYHRSGPVGHMFSVTSNRNETPKVGMIGLGTGSVACYADKKLGLTFFEIDPTVVGLVADRKRDSAWQQRRARSDKFDPKRDPFFSYVIDAEERGADVKIVKGDARLKLEEMKDAKFDLLLVDAFSSDAIPVHLLTKESLQLYLDHLTENGLLGLHISNKYVKLDLVVAKLAEELNLTAMEFNDSWVEDESSSQLQHAPAGKTGSTWVVLARNPAQLDAFKQDRYTTQYRYVNPEMKDENGKIVPQPPPSINRWHTMKAHPKMKVWTDDYADVMQVMMLPAVQKLRGLFGQTTLAELEKEQP